MIVPVVGPVVGGLIVSNLSWRWLFYVNVPICLAGLILAWRGRPASPPAPVKPRLDLAGLALLSPGLAAVLYGLAQVSAHHGFGHPAVLIPLAAGLAVLAGSWPGRCGPAGRSSRSSTCGCSGTARSPARPA